jgi:hypothetical protein
VSLEIVIPKRFNGPPASAHGGYVAGAIAEALGETVEVTLRRPPPLDRPLRVVGTDTGGWELRDGEETVCEVTACAPLEVSIPRAPSLAEAADAVANGSPFDNNPWDGCFVCGHGRAPGDGLRIFAGRLADGRGTAAPWTPEADTGDGNGHVRPEFIWSALDCPGGAAIAPAGRQVLLGRYRVRQMAPVICGVPHVVMGWKIGGAGRKWLAGTAIFDAEGRAKACAEALWIVLKQPL